MKVSKRVKTTSRIIILSAFLLLILYLYLDDERIILTDQVRSSLEGQFVELPLGVVHYEIAGPPDGPVVVLVPGFSVPYYIWDPTFEGLKNSGFRVLRYDLLGRGYSDRPRVEYTLELYVEQLQQLLSALNLKSPVHLAGLSYGGPIIAAYANRYTDDVQSIILIDPVTAPVPTKEIFPINVPLLGEYLMGVYVAPFMLPQSQLEDFYRPEQFPGWEKRYQDQMQYTGFKRAILSSIRNTVHIDAIKAYETLGKQGLPVLLIWGKEDQTISSVEMVIIRQAIPDVEFHAIEDAGHISHFERPDIVNPILVEFITTYKP